MTIQIQVKGMTCGHCEKTVTRLLLAVPGVQQASADKNSNSAAIVFDEKITTTVALIEAINASGIYTASI